MADVIPLNCVTTHDIPAKRVIDNIPEDMHTIVVIGYRENSEPYAATSITDPKAILGHLAMLGEFVENNG